MPCVLKTRWNVPLLLESIQATLFTVQEWHMILQNSGNEWVFEWVYAVHSWGLRYWKMQFFQNTLWSSSESPKNRDCGCSDGILRRAYFACGFVRTLNFRNFFASSLHLLFDAGFVILSAIHSKLLVFKDRNCDFLAPANKRFYISPRGDDGLRLLDNSHHLVVLG